MFITTLVILFLLKLRNEILIMEINFKILLKYLHFLIKKVRCSNLATSIDAQLDRDLLHIVNKYTLASFQLTKNLRMFCLKLYD